VEPVSRQNGRIGDQASSYFLPISQHAQAALGLSDSSEFGEHPIQFKRCQPGVQ
jgi:hypothetical protein